MIHSDKLRQIIQHIYRDLASDARKGTNGIFWETVNLVPNEHQVLKDVNETLVTGVSGIIVFLMEYYKETQDATALEKIDQATEWLLQYCHEKKLVSVGFYYGRSGVAYTLIELAQLTKQDHLLEKAEAMVAACNDFVTQNSKIIPANFANGLAGLLFVQAKLFQVTKKLSLLDDIQTNLGILLRHLRINDSGVHFDQPFYSTKPLISFPEGNAGIGHMLMQLGHYFTNETLISLAKQLFAYENACYSSKTKNWPDFANNDYYNKNKNRYAQNSLNRNKKFFDVESDTVSWLMGAPSVGYSRVTSVLAGQDQYLADVDKAISKSETYIKQSLTKPKQTKFTLSSGLGGVGLFLLEAQKVRENPKTLSLVEEVANQAIQQYEQLSYFKSDHYFASEIADNTLFTGECGVGYFFIQLLRQNNSGTILSPRIDLEERSQYTLEKLNMPTVYYTLLQTYYARSFQLLIQHQKHLGFDVTNQAFCELHDRYAQYVGTLTEDVEKLQSVFTLESKKIQLLKANDNFHYAYARNKSFQDEHTKFLESTDDEKLLKSRLCINDYCQLGHYQNGEKRYVALKQVYNGVHEMPLNEFSFTIFNTFHTPKTVKDAIEEIIQSTGAKKEEREEIKQLTLEQVRQGLKVSLLHIKKVKFLGFTIS